MTEEQSSYRQIMKATSIFGGVQIYNIAISVIRSKFIAILLGPAGMGISGLLTSTTGLIANFSNLGLNTSAIKNVAAANATGNVERVSRVVSVLRRLVWITGIIGTLFTMIFAPWLSEVTFGNKDHTLAFRLISFTLLLAQINAGQLVVLQGMRKLKFLAKANIAGNTVALLTGIPLYYFFGIQGIVPAIIVSSFMTLVFSWYFSSKVNVKTMKVDKASLFSEGGDMIKMGFFLSLSSLIATSLTYLIRIFISHKGGLAEVGFYNAGMAIIHSYVGLVFTAMSTDYFPRLSGIANDAEKASNMINQQAEVAILILAPILTVFLIFINFIVILLYSTKFLPIVGLIQWAALSTFLKAASWPISYLFIAKGHTRLFFYSEVSTNIYMLVIRVLGYLWGGLEGLGIGIVISSLIYFIQVYIIARIKYTFFFTTEFYKILGLQFILGLLCFASIRLLETPYSFIVGSILIIISFFFSIKALNKRLNLIPLIFDRFKKR